MRSTTDDPDPLLAMGYFTFCYRTLLEGLHDRIEGCLFHRRLLGKFGGLRTVCPGENIA
jgi:hypothetical protein